MKKTEQRKLLTMTGFTEVGWSFIGIFFLFFVQKNFGLEVWQTITWFALLQLVFGLVVYPINYGLLRHYSPKTLVALGTIFEVAFVSLLALGWTDAWSFVALNISMMLYFALFWPSYNYLITLSTQEHGRGKFLANLQTLYIGAGVLTPAFTGWLFDLGNQHLALWAALGFYAVSLMIAMRLHPGGSFTPVSRPQSLTHFKDLFLDKNRFWGFLPDITSEVVMWVIWPFYFQWVVGKFFIMGAITSVAAFFEIFAAQLVGRLADKYSSQKILQFTAWARVLDLNLRAVYLIFSPTWFVTGVQVMGSFLGPLFQIPYDQRVMEMSELSQTPAKLFDFFVVREVFLGIGRAIFLLISASLIYYFGIAIAGIIIAVCGLTALGAKKL